MEPNNTQENRAYIPEVFKNRESSQTVCPWCGGILEDSQTVCPNCGRAVDIGQPAEIQSNFPKKKKTGMIMGIITAAVVVLAIAIAAVFFFSKNPRSYQRAQELYNANEYAQALELFEELGDYKDSKNMAIDCKYNEGIILIQSGDYTGAEPLFSELGDYKDCEMYLDMVKWERAIDELLDPSASWVKIGGDKSYIQIDTNPDDTDSDDFGLLEWADLSAANDKLHELSTALGFSEALVEKMNKTTALQGVQSETAGRFSVSWTYHPDKGLEATYEFKHS